MTDTPAFDTPDCHLTEDNLVTLTTLHYYINTEQLSTFSSQKINRIMNSSNERKSNIPGEERDENASLEKLDTEKVKEDDTLDKDDENESRSNTPESEKETEKDVDLNTVRQTMQRLWETNDFLKESYQLDLKVRKFTFLHIFIIMAFSATIKLGEVISIKDIIKYFNI